MFSDPIFCSFPDASLWPGWRLSQSVGDWLPRATTFCHILILENPGFLPKASGAGLKSLTLESTWCKTAIRIWWERDSMCSAEAELFWEVVGQLELFEVLGKLLPDGHGIWEVCVCTLCSQLLPFPSMCQAVLLGKPSRVSLELGPVLCPHQWDNYLLPKLSFRPDLLSPGICSGATELCRRGFSLILFVYFPIHFPILIVLFSQHVWLVPSQYLCRSKSRS